MNLYFPCLLFLALLRGSTCICAQAGSYHNSLVLESTDPRVQELYANAPGPLITQKCLDSNTFHFYFYSVAEGCFFSPNSSNYYPFMIISRIKR